MRLMLCGCDDSRPRAADAFSPFDAGGHEKVTAADCMVIPLARSAGKKSVTVEPSSTSGDHVSVLQVLTCAIVSIALEHNEDREESVSKTCA